MTRSFGLVDTKIQEAEYFLDRILDDGTTFFGIRCDTVAFASSARSVTFAMQASLAGLEEFNRWYAERQTELRANPLARFFHEFRRISQHVGDNVVVGGVSGSAPGRTRYLFGAIPEIPTVPDADVASACEGYFRLLLELVYECYNEFAPLVNGQWYFTRGNFETVGKTIEDAEEELGLPRGWSAVSGFNEDVRWRYLRKEADGCNILSQFYRWLGKELPHPDAIEE